MLAPCRYGRQALRASQRRGFFDVLAQTQAKPNADGSVAAVAGKKKEFGWEWLKWFQENSPEVVEATQMGKFKELLQARETFCLSSTRPSSNINWDEWRGKIKDPAFVETLRAKYCADYDIANSYTDPQQEQTWSEEAKAAKLKEYQAEMKKFGITATDAGILDFNSGGCKAFDKKVMEMGRTIDDLYTDKKRDLYLSYEQAEAERDLFGYRGEMMDYAEHPEIAEMSEENLASKQTYSDKILFCHEFHRFHKRERLAQCQDDAERERFLQRYKDTIRIHGHSEQEGS